MYLSVGLAAEMRWKTTWLAVAALSLFVFALFGLVIAIGYAFAMGSFGS